MEFGAGGKGESDDTEALKKCLSEGQRQGRTVWIPAGEYKVTGDIVLPSHVKLQGAGMWHTVFVGDEKLYKMQATRAVQTHRHRYPPRRFRHRRKTQLPQRR